MRWLDSRVYKPTPKHYNQYQVVFQYCGSIFVGYCGYRPNHDYTKGSWDSPKFFNGNQMHDGVVLAWKENPEVPKIIRIGGLNG